MTVPDPTAGGSSNANLNQVVQMMAQTLSAAGGSTSGSSSDNAPVYWGMTGRHVSRYALDNKPQLIATPSPITTTYKEAINDFNNWDTKKLNDFIAQGVVGGLLSRGDGEIQAYKLWEQLVTDSARYTGSGNNVSPWDILAGYVKSAGGMGQGQWVDQGNGMQTNVLTGARRYVGPQFKTTSQTAVDLTDPQTAAALTTKVFQDLLGRDPMPGELGAYAAALNSAEQAAPVTTTTTTQYDSQGNPIHQDVTKAGGLTAEGEAQMLEQKAKGTKEYGATQAATTYANALQAAIWGAH